MNSFKWYEEFFFNVKYTVSIQTHPTTIENITFLIQRLVLIGVFTFQIIGVQNQLPISFHVNKMFTVTAGDVSGSRMYSIDQSCQGSQQ